MPLGRRGTCPVEKTELIWDYSKPASAVWENKDTSQIEIKEEFRKLYLRKNNISKIPTLILFYLFSLIYA